MAPADARAWLALLRADGIGAGTAARVLDHFGSPQHALDGTAAHWQSGGLAPQLRENLRNVPQEGIDGDLAWLEGSDARGLLTRDDPRYPALLRNIAQAPPALFYQGDAEVLAMPQLAIVGARTATPQGVENARAFAAELAGRGLIITSGLALGIDAAAHRGALEADGLTIAVCGTGLDRVYPARHRQLAHQIAGQGVLISEFPPGVQAMPENFPKRNRVISGLVLGVLVVEAARESGSLITARLASEQGREVFAIPGSIHNPLAHGCHALIRQGAKLVEKADDILEELGPRVAAHLRERRGADAATAVEASAEEQTILDALGHAALSFDLLMERTQLPADIFHGALLKLELRGAVAAAGGGNYMRVFRPAEAKKR